MKKIIMIIGLIGPAMLLQAQEAPAKAIQKDNIQKQTLAQKGVNKPTNKQNDPDQKNRIQDTARTHKPQPKLSGEGKHVPDTMRSDRPYISQPDTIDPKKPK